MRRVCVCECANEGRDLYFAYPISLRDLSVSRTRLSISHAIQSSPKARGEQIFLLYPSERIFVCIFFPCKKNFRLEACPPCRFTQSQRGTHIYWPAQDSSVAISWSKYQRPPDKGTLSKWRNVTDSLSPFLCARLLHPC